MRPIVALVLLSSVAAVGSVLKAQERAPTGAPPTFAARAAGSSSRPSATPTLSPAAGFETLVKPFLAENCYGCHGNKKHKKDLNFEAIESVESLVTDGDRWDDVVQKLRARDMPPEDEPQPAEHQRQAVATWIARELARIEKHASYPGRITARRLNRTESIKLSRNCSASTRILQTTSRRTTPVTVLTISPTCCRSRRC